MSNNNEITKRLWEAADQLRANSGLKYSQFARPILGLIFLRYADFKFTLAQKELEKASQKEPEKGTMDAYIPRRKKVSPSDYQSKGVLFLPEKAQYSYILNLPESENIGKALYEAMNAIEKENDDLKGVLDIEYSEIEDSVLIALIKLFSEIDFQYNDDIFGKIYEYFLGKFAMSEGQRGGEFFTPESLVKLIVEILEPKKGRIYDPASGSGGMFVQSANYVRRFGKKPMDEITVFGQEKTLETVKLCKINLAVHGISGDIRQGNTYFEDLHNSINKFDYVMANPPFNVNGVNKEAIKKDERFLFGIPRADNANYLWIQIFLNALNNKGRAGFVMANSASNIGQSEKEIRKKIINTGYIDILISIAPNFFYNVTLPCILWFFDKNKKKTNRTKKILFIDAQKIYNQVDRAHRDFLPEQIEFISNIIKLYREEKVLIKNGSAKLLKKYFPKLKYKDVPGLCKLATLEEVSKKDFSLNPGRYVGIEIQKEEDYDFFLELKSLFDELEELNENALEIGEQILENFEFLLKREKYE